MRGLKLNPSILIAGTVFSLLFFTALPLHAAEEVERIDGQTQTALGRIVEMENKSVKIKSDASTWLRPGDEIEFISSGIVKQSKNGELVLEMTEGWPDIELMATIVPLDAKPEPEPAPVAEEIPEPAIDESDWANMSADQLYENGGKYYRGEKVSQDYQTAMLWFKRAADKGHIGALNDIGVMHELGQGVDKNPEEAVKWYRKGETKNHALAHFNLGRAYEKGLGVPKDYSEALKSYRRAARLGDKNAQAKLIDRRLRW